jgi:membrane protease subunit HflC
MNNKLAIVLVLVGVLAVGLYASAFIVDETEQAVITRFGEIIRDTITDPGLNFRTPFIDTVSIYPKNLLQWDGDPGQIPTLEKTYIWVDAFARWKIVNAKKFKETIGSLFDAKNRLDDIIDPAVRDFVSKFRLVETVRRTNREMDTFEIGVEKDSEEAARGQLVVLTGREKITEGILKQAQPKLDKFGIELVDVKIKRINYVDQVRESVYNRMVAERKQIAEKFRSEGVGEARKIRGDKERELKRITSEAYRQAEEIKGKADAEATRIYAEAYGVDPEFYSFLKTLEVYNEALPGDSALVLSTDSEFLKYLRTLPAAK